MTETLDLVQLRTFVAIADCGGFSRAAVAIHLSQSTVSQHVRLLEQRLRQPLVEKDGRRSRFTEAGERLLIEARRILAVHDEAMERLLADPAARTIVVGSTETAADQVLPALLARMRAAYPERGVQFRIDRSTQMSDAVLRGEIDLAVILGFGAETPGHQVGALPLRWFTAPGWDKAPGAPWPLVAYVEPCGMRRRALQLLGDAGMRVEIVTESTSLEGVLAAARAGLGVAVLPTAGSSPTGLVERHGFPDLGEIDVMLAARRGLAPEIEVTALAALAGFFAGGRPSALSVA